MSPGMVYLVGAGPGNPGLCTLRGMECLRRADVVLYDYLVSPALVSHARPEAERLCLGRHGHGRLLSQDEINALMVNHARQGRTVVRLKGGDPTIFAHAAEELDALAAAGVPFEIVPGVTAGVAVGAYAGVPLTHRDAASAVALVTGREDAAKPEPELDFAALARFPGTLVFYMGVTTAKSWTAALLAAGKHPDTPALIVRRCTWPDQLVVACGLRDVPREIERRHLRPPVVVVVGDVATLGRKYDWLSRRPLFGQRVLVTRSAEQSGELATLLHERGAEVLEQPAITISPPDDWQPVDAAIDRLPTYDWVVFSSANGVRFFLGRLWERGLDLRRLGTARLAAVGSATADALAAFQLRADRVPQEYHAEALAEAIGQDTAGKRCLLVRASRGREALGELLATGGATVEQVVAYASRDVPAADPAVADALAAGRVHWVTVTSPAIARSLVHLFGDRLRQTQLASLSPITSATLRELGHEPRVEAIHYTMNGLVAAMTDHHAAVPYQSPIVATQQPSAGK